MPTAWYLDITRGFQKVEVVGREPSGKVKIIEGDGRDRLCAAEELYAYTEESQWLVAQAAKYAEIRKQWALVDLDLSRRMPPYEFEE